MRLSEKTIGALAEIIAESPYRTGPQLIEFFGRYGDRDLYGPEFGARAAYTLRKLRQFNGQSAMRAIVADAFDQFDREGADPEAMASLFNRKLMLDGYALTIEFKQGFMHGDQYIEGPPFFKILERGNTIPEPEGLTSLQHEAVAEQVGKCRDRIANGDFSGAIASTYTLVEEFLKLVLKDAEVEFQPQQGDIRELYRVLRTKLGLDPSEQGMDPTLKPILDGLQKIVGGLFDMSNRASDRHARIYNPSKRHAKLAVNAAFSFCEFVLDVIDARRAKNDGSTAKSYLLPK